MSFRIINGKVVSVEIPKPAAEPSKVNKGESFKDIFEAELYKAKEVKLSGHAIERLKRRNIELDNSDMKKLSEAIEKADAKGARESLLLYKDTAFIASVKNRTIITAIDSESTKDNVFTNIDSAVIIS